MNSLIAPAGARRDVGRRYGRMELAYTFDDPQAFTRPWSATVRFDLQPDTELLEHQCENDKWRATIR